MQFSDEFLERWEHIIDDVDITDVPLECIKKVVVKLYGKKQRTINLDLLRRQGLDIEEIETVSASRAVPSSPTLWLVTGSQP